MNRLYSLICVCLITLCFHYSPLLAGEITHVAYSMRTTYESQFLANPQTANIFISDPLSVELQGAPPEYEVNRKVRVRLIYGREELSDVVGNYFKYKINYVLYDEDTGQDIDTGVLEIEFGENESIFEAVNEHLNVSGNHRVWITSICGDDTGDGSYDELCLGQAQDIGIGAEDIRIEVELVVDKTYYLDYVTEKPEIVSIPTYVVGQYSQVDIAWSFLAGFESYELEYVYWDSESNDFPDTSDPNYEKILFERAIRIETWDQHYVLDVSYPSGRLFYRVRGIGRFIHNVNGDYTIKKDGQWSEIVQDEISDSAPVLKPFEVDKNWQFTSSFAEEGKYKKVLSYYDGTLHSRQVLTNLSDEKLTLIAEADYNLEGQSTVNILPTPLGNANGLNQNNLFFKQALNQNSLGQPYSYTDFDKADGADPLNNLSGAGQYFSSNNNMEGIYKDYIPDAGNMPFTQTRYRRDVTGRMAIQSGVGAQYQFGPDDHPIKYYYLNGNSTELHRLFGSNVGDATHYKKNIVLDANGQASASYIDQYGRVIATSLIGNSPDNVLPLDGNSLGLIEKDLMGSNVKSELISYSHNTIFNPAVGTTYDFTYQLNGVFLNDLGYDIQDFCVTCEYVLEITIKDEAGNQVFFLTEDFPIGNYNCNNGDFYEEAPLTFSTILYEIGTYEIIKELRVAGNNLNISGLQELIAVLLPDVDDYISNLVDQIDFDICDFNCYQNCFSALVNSNPEFFEDDLSVKPDQELAFSSAIMDCIQTNCLDVLIEDGDYVLEEGAAAECDGRLDQMKVQVSPGGIGYESFINGDIFIFLTDEVTTILDVVQELLNLSFYVVDENGIVWTIQGGNIMSPGGANVGDELVVVDEQGGNPVTINDMDDFFHVTNGVLFNEQYWQDQWGDALVQIHREYCLYLQCLDFNTTANPDDESSYDYNIRLFTAFIPEDTEISDGVNDLTMNYLLNSPDDFLALMISQDPYFSPASSPYFDPPTPFVSSCPISGLPVELPPILTITYYLQNFYDTPDGIVSIFDVIEMYIQEQLTNANAPYFGATTEVLNSLRWTMLRGAYMDEKERLGFECTNCYTASDEHAIFTMPDFSEVNEPGEIDDWVDDNVGPMCEMLCAGQADLWLQQINLYLLENCGTSIDPTSPDGLNILAAFESFCTANCADGAEVVVEIMGDDIAVIVSAVEGILAGYLNNCPSGTTVEDVINITVTSSTTNTVTNGWQEIDECFLVMVQAMNEHLFVNCYAGNTYVATTDEEVDCFVDMSTYIPTPSINGILIHGIPYSCVDIYGNSSPAPEILFQFYDENGIRIDACGSNISEISEATIEALPSGYNDPGFGQDYTGITLTLELGIANVSQKVYLFMTNKFGCDFITGYTLNMQEVTEECQQELIAQATQEAIDQWQEDVDVILSGYYNIIGNCIDNVQEQFYVSYQDVEHHYTLYYYDQGGNLVQTVPPIGVDVLDDNHFDDGIWLGHTNPGNHEPNHTQQSIYKYTSLEQIREQETPDAGIFTFEYNYSGQLRISQNAKQETAGHYSFTRYDEQSRVTEVGQLEGYSYTDENAHKANLNDLNFPYESGQNYSLTQRTQTVYDKAIPFNGFQQDNLRSRVALTFNDHIETRYSYDVHGNVKALQHNISVLDGHTIEAEYDYDMISGNVLELAYQKGEIDEFYHKYEYDANNRLTHAYTSDDHIIWERDARYFYYLHGPLARMEVGHDKVQGMDYYYSLQGWIKGVNMPGYQSYIFEPGQDGSKGGQNKHVGRDEMSYALGYNNLDYQSIGDIDMGAANGDTWTNFANSILPIPETGYEGLYNGNIAWMITDLSKFNEIQDDKKGLQAMTYQYDQLHRIREASSYEATVTGNNLDWSTTSNNKYNASFTYDGNGNLQTLSRNAFKDGVVKEMDELDYTYFTSQGLPNRLHYINETADHTLEFPESVQTSDFGNYAYDEIGNMTKDLSGGISNVVWNRYGKVDAVSSGITGFSINFTYDAAGNRLTKVDNSISDGGKTLIYIRDASGNILSIYEKEVQFINTILKQKEIPLYGSSRIGQMLIDRTISGGEQQEEEGKREGDSRSRTTMFNRERGDKVFEFSNHLGNVLTVVGDQKLGITPQGETVAWYEGDVKSANDYYPFGMQMPNRTLNSPDYRYGFNGKEKDEGGEFGNLTHYDYGFRIYNPGIGRFLSVDPLLPNYPFYTPYQFAANSPIFGVDLDGAEFKHYGALEHANGSMVIKRHTEYTIPWKQWTIPGALITIFSLDYFDGSTTIRYPLPEAYILDVGFDQFVFGSFSDLMIYSQSIDWDHFAETHEVKFNSSVIFGGEEYDTSDRPHTLAEIEGAVAGFQMITTLVLATAAHVSTTRTSGTQGRRAGDGPGAKLADGAKIKKVEQPRNAKGQFMPKKGGEVKPGSVFEQQVWDGIKTKPGWKVVEGQIGVRDATGQLRYYDGYAVSPSGNYIGLETKSGVGYPKTQRTFDARLNQSIDNKAHGVGKHKGVVIDRSILIRKKSD